MELDDLKDAWGSAGQAGGASLDELIPRLRRMRRGLLWRDAREIVAAAAGFPVFVWIGSRPEVRGAARIGVGLVLAGLLLIVAVVLWARHPRARIGSSMGEHLRAELTLIDRQISILQHVAWWSVAPVVVGCDLFVAGLRGAHSMFAVVYAIVTIGAGVFLIWLNRRGAHRLRPLRDSLLRGLEAVRESQTEH
jgi:hypothetical protein